MAQSSSIEWTEATWNPVTGCTKISPGCRNCYAERMAKRLKAMGRLGIGMNSGSRYSPTWSKRRFAGENRG